MYDYEKERREAIEAGNKALESLRTAQAQLDKAKNWGLVDMFGGGLVSSVLKRSRMKDAQANMEQARYTLRTFSKELNDVNMRCDLNLEVNDFLSFADLFFDNFGIDWLVQDRINTARSQVEEAIYQVRNILHQLER